jgi:predicted nucleotidyltransferase
MNETEKLILEKFKALLEEKVRLHKLILFGSRAKGDADPQSDMDVVVVVEGELTRFMRDYISDSAWEAGFEHGIVIVPILFTKHEWEEGPERHSLLVQAVKLEGITL